MINTIFKLGCAMFICTVVFAYLLVYMESRAIATRKPLSVYTTAQKTPSASREQKGCSCCAERMAKLRDRINQQRVCEKAAE